jgi:hypothetical protein
MAFLSFTRLRLRAWYYVPAFVVQTGRSTRQARRANGFITGALSADIPHLTFWTVTVWKNEAAMRAFRIGDPHKTIMRDIRWCDEAAVAHREQTTEGLPTGADALDYMRQHGRVVKVEHPSLEHVARLTVPDGRAPNFRRPLRPLGLA